MQVDWQLVLTIASVLTAIGVILGTARKWGGAIVKKLVGWAWSELTIEEIKKNKPMDIDMQAQTELVELLKQLNIELQENTRVTLKLEIKDLIRNHPERTDTIESTMEEYHAVHGNSYIDNLYNEWKEKYEKKAFNEMLNKGDR